MAPSVNQQESFQLSFLSGRRERCLHKLHVPGSGGSNHISHATDFNQININIINSGGFTQEDKTPRPAT